MQVLTIGEILWDVFDHGEFLGGAPLNFSAAVQRFGHSVALVTGLGSDPRGALARQAMLDLGLSTDFVQVLPGCATGIARVSTDSNGNATFFIPRPAAFDAYRLDEAQLEALAALQPGWIYFGTLTQTQPIALATLESILQRLPPAMRFDDMNLREGHWNLPLVQRLSRRTSILKMNDHEAETLFALTRPDEEYSLEAFCRYWSTCYEVEILCVTLGSKGCAVYRQNALHLFDGFTVQVADTVGAGDAFAAAFLHSQIQCWLIARQASFANALGALVASRSGATPAWTVDECLQRIANHSV